MFIINNKFNGQYDEIYWQNIGCRNNMYNILLLF